MKHRDKLSGECLEATLDSASIGHRLTIQQVQVPDMAPEWGRWLEEIGFIAGEQVMVMARAQPGGDPLVVRVGQSTFALRRAEAACVQVLPSGSTEALDLVDYPQLVGSQA